MGSRALNIAMFTETFVPHANGVTTSILNSRRGLFDRGHRVTVYSAGPPVQENESVHYYGGKTFPLYPDFPVAILPNRAARENKRILEQQKADLVHIHAPGPMGLRGYAAARRHKLPFIVTYHTEYEPLVRYAPFGYKTFFRVASRAVNKLLNKRCRVLIAPSKAIQRRLVERGGLEEHKVRVVPTGIDLDRFQPNLDASSVRDDWGFNNGERVVLWLGRVAFEKRLDVLLDAFAAVRKDEKDLRLVIAGSGPATGEFRSRAMNLGLDGSIRFVGHVRDEDVPLYYNAADVFASASAFETQGLTLLEAMACGTPSAVAAAGGFLDVVEDGHNGYLFEPDNVAAASEGLRRALSAPSALRSAARETARQYGIDRCALLLEDAYEEALAAPTAR